MTAILCLTQGSLDLARTLRMVLGDAEIHGLGHRVAGADLSFTDTVAHVRALFERGETIIGICAAGILIRAVGPLVENKLAEPPVLAIAADGSSVVPLLGGHRGANRLALRLAEAIGGAAAITTAGDTALRIALDDPPPGWTVVNPRAAKPVAAAMLAGESVGLTVEAGSVDWLGDASRFGPPKAGAAQITVTHRALDPAADQLLLHPPVLALGVGCERNADPAAVIDLAMATLADAGLAPAAVACVVSLDLKADEAAVHALAERLGVPARFFPASRLLEETSRLATPSDTVFAEVGCYGVAEGAALAVVGPDGRLVVPKQKSAVATCAVTLSRGDIDPQKTGVARGRLSIVGIGPGARAWRTKQAEAILSEAEEIVGYGLYLDLIADLIEGKPRQMTDLGAETERARYAIERAATGRHVALVSSGDAGIYGLATLAWELLETAADPAWRRIIVETAPGISAVQAAASRLGAAIGHDFCTISLSDLLTAWPDIQIRLEAAASADFVVALYNPRSERRDWQLPRALAIFAASRPPTTPVALARNLGRADERIIVTTLAECQASDVDMLTLVLIGNSTSRSFTHDGRARIFTPRGYAGKSTGQS